MLLLPPLGFVFFSFCSSVTLHASLNNNINQKPKIKKHLIAATPTFSFQTIEIGSFSFSVPPFAHPSFVFFCSLGRLSIRPSAFLPPYTQFGSMLLLSVFLRTHGHGPWPSLDRPLFPWYSICPIDLPPPW
ncbi:hypothetical protein BKA57DRAFT_100289 [Linnemannia elongata]|nr:hypothetical protein BKA57DRAFT_100289 [Linnemannia elongata]